MKKILQPIAMTAAVVLFFTLPTFESNFTSWRTDRKNKKIAEDEILVEKNYYEMGNKKLKDRDIFMVKCIPAIQEISEKCEAERNAIDEKYPYEIRAESLGDKCERDLLNSLVISK